MYLNNSVHYFLYKTFSYIKYLEDCINCFVVFVWRKIHNKGAALESDITSKLTHIVLENISLTQMMSAMTPNYARPFMGKLCR